jgi:lipid-A-disaccharide synthase
MKVLLSAGEVSGDMIAASLAAELQRRDPTTRIWGLGGARMRASGVEVRTETNELGRIGVSESFSAILPFLEAFKDVRRKVREDRPDVAVLVANDVFNAILGRWLRARGIPTLALFPPQVWIWRSLLRFFSPSYDLVAASFPIEQQLYAKHARTRFVGHPLADSLEHATPETRTTARASFQLREEDLVVGVLPGSRIHELQLLTPVLLDACAQLLRTHPSIHFLLPVAEREHESSLTAELERRGLAAHIRLVDRSHDVMRAADLLLLASGTATLEASLIGVPMVAVYRVFPLTVFIVRMAIRLGLMDSETLTLPNLLIGREVVPEIRQEHLSAERVAAEASALLADPDALASMRTALGAVREAVDGHGCIAHVADLAEGLVRERSTPRATLVPLVVEGESS